MRKLTLAAMAAVVLATTACAQTAPGPGGHGPGYGMGPGMGPGMGMGPRAGSEVTPGWSMMDPKEREEHMRAMQSARTPEECRKMRDEHLQRMRQRGMGNMAMPPRDACAGMQ